MTTDKKTWIDTLPLGMLSTGGVLAIAGAIMWGSNTQFEPNTFAEAVSPAWQFIGAVVGGFGLLLVALAWTVSAIGQQR